MTVSVKIISLWIHAMVQIGVSKNNTPHVAVKMRFVLIKIGFCKALSPLYLFME